LPGLGKKVARAACVHDRLAIPVVGQVLIKNKKEVNYLVEKTIGVPSVKGMQGSFTDYAVGAGGGLIYGLARVILGSGFIGSLAAPILAGSVVKGPRGTALATIAGFMALSGLFGAPTTRAAADTGTM